MQKNRITGKREKKPREKTVKKTRKGKAIKGFEKMVKKEQ
jgi:hypothetical protein